MYQNSQTNENVNSPNTGVPQEKHFDICSNGLQQPPSNILYNDLNAACDYSGGLSVNDNEYHDVNTPTFHPNEMQYNYSTEQASIQYPPPQFVMNMPPSLPAVNLAQIQTNYSEIFRFVVPGYYVIMLPMSSTLVVNSNNLDFQLNQEQSYVSNVSDGSTINTQSAHQHQHQSDQQLNR